MSRVVVRAIGEADREGYASVASMTYNDGLDYPPERFESRFGVERYVGLVGDEVAGILSVLPMNATRGAALVPCGGVAGVGVAPERRRGGVGNGMMDGLVRLLREQGVPLSSL